MRQPPREIRQSPPGAVRASWAAGLARSIAFAALMSALLTLVGAFGTLRMALLPRAALFAVIGLGSALAVAGCVAMTGRIEALRRRVLLRMSVICLVLAVVVGAWTWLVMGFWFFGAPRPSLLPTFLGYSFFMSAIMTVLSWAVFRPRTTVVTSAPPEPPRFLERLPLKLRGAQIYAVQAEDHYLRLHTSLGSDLILMRLSDAVAELEGIEGAQTHRSWWVARNAVSDVRRGDGRAVLTLKSGVEVPVSRSYAPTLRQAGWL